jgi:ribosome-associated heat shock protein Hsp15
MEKVRIDKWLWCVRIYKSRTLASDACRSGKILLGEHEAKASDTVTVGQTVNIKKDGFNFRFLVKNLIDKRVGAPIAQQCYEDLTPEDERNKYKAWFIGKKGVEFREKGSGRPTKKERREIDDFKSDRFYQ